MCYFRFFEQAGKPYGMLYMQLKHFPPTWTSKLLALLIIYVWSNSSTLKVMPCVNLYTCTEGYNQYVELIGGAIGAGACAALQQGNKIHTIADDIPLLHFLSGKTYLTVVMTDFSS